MNSAAQVGRGEHQMSPLLNGGGVTEFHFLFIGGIAINICEVIFARNFSPPPPVVNGQSLMLSKFDSNWHLCICIVLMGEGLLQKKM